MVSEAQAQQWFGYGFFRPHRYRVYQAAPDYMPVRRRGWVYADPNYDPGFPYGGPPFNGTYYDPSYDGSHFGQPPAPHRAVKSKPVKKQTVRATPNPAKPTAPKSTTAATSTIGETDKPVASNKPAIATGPDKTLATSTANLSAPSSPSLSCDKATAVVTGFGFSEVKAATCSGMTYAFNAVRDGKPYVVKLDAASGELTEVKKTQ